MIASGHNHQTLQPPLQNIGQTQPKQQASPEDKKRNQICVQNWHEQLSNKNIFHGIEVNRLIIRISDNTTNIYKSIISVHCPSQPTHKWLLVSRETFEKRHADIYLGYDPSTLQPEGFAMRNQLFLTCEVLDKSGAPLYGITRKELDPNIDQLFDLNYLLKNSQLEPPISYVN